MKKNSNFEFLNKILASFSVVSAVRSMLCSLTTSIFPWMLQLCIMAYFLVLTAYIASYEGDPVYNTGSNSSNASIANSDAGDPCTPTLTYDNVTLNNGSGQLIASVSPPRPILLIIIINSFSSREQTRILFKQLIMIKKLLSGRTPKMPIQLAF